MMSYHQKRHFDLYLKVLWQDPRTLSTFKYTYLICTSTVYKIEKLISDSFKGKTGQNWENHETVKTM